MYTRDVTLPSTGPESTAPTFRPGPDVEAGRKVGVADSSFLYLPSLACDLVLVSVALLVVVFRAPIAAADQHALAHVLQLRISLSNLLTAGTCVALWILPLRMATKDNRRQPIDFWLFADLVLRVVGCAGVLCLVLLVSRPRMLNLPTLGMFASLTFVLLLLGRLAATAYAVLIAPSTRKQRNVIIVGSGWRGQEVSQQLQVHPKWSYQLFGFVDSVSSNTSSPLLGSVEMLEEILMTNPIDEVIITLPVKSKYDDIQNVIAICERLGIQSRYSTDLFATQITKRRSVDRHDPFSVLLHVVHSDSRRIVKRVFDFVAALTGLIVLSPLFLFLAVWIKLSSPGPVFFCQQRYGLNKRRFALYKFRSMVADAELQQRQLEHLNETAGPVFKIRRDPRITKVGRFIRKSSIDELPQLWNVLIGDMSLVGPRPLPERDVNLFSEAWLMRRFSVPPGITGLWQISGRSNTSFARWIRLDLEYIDRWSLFLDFQIIAKTFPAVLKGDGAV